MGRDIWALKVTKNAKTIADNARPAVLYNAQQHAREWLAGETCKRTLEYFTENYGEDTEAGEIVTPLVDSRELWFVCISNPDGYEYTFTPGNRLWRKNMADNNGDGVRGEPGDGVDPNRNFPTNWGRDNEGSSDDPYSETYRGTGRPPSRRPRRCCGSGTGSTSRSRRTTTPRPSCCCIRSATSSTRGRRTTASSRRWPVTTSSRGSPTRCSRTASGAPSPTGSTRISAPSSTSPTATRSRPPTRGHPRLHSRGLQARSGEGAARPSGFEFQDDEADIEAEFQRHRLFSLDLAQSAEDPTNPVSHMGNETHNFYVKAFSDSYGRKQWVEVDAKKTLGPGQIRWRINGGPVQSGRRAASTRASGSGRAWPLLRPPPRPRPRRASR